jgi:PAS domain S-box-containing protein
MIKRVAEDRRALDQAEHAAAVAASPHATVLMSPAGLITTFNPAAALLFGHAAEDVVGRAIDLLIPAERRDEEAAVLRRVVTGDHVPPYRTDRVCRDGTVVTVLVTVTAYLDADGNIAGAGAVARRASDLEEAHDQLELRVDHQRRDVQDAQDRFQIGMDAERVRERAQVQDAEERFEARMDVARVRERAQVQDTEERFEARMDAARVRERAQVQEDEARFQVGMNTARTRERAQAQDTEDRFQVGIALERATALSEKGDLQLQVARSQRLDVLGQLAGGVAHDFNNLLALILNYAGFAIEGLTSDPAPDVAAAVRDIEQIQAATERAAELTHQLLAFASREVVQPRVLDLNGIVNDVEQLLRRTFGERVVLRTELAPDLLPMLADGGKIEQVLVNLAVNARDAMSSRGGFLTIETANVADAGSGNQVDHIRLRVTDTGDGMTGEVIERAFDPFFTTKPEGKGTGLGLATVYGIVTQAGGDIQLTSQPGVGTTFTLTFPATDQVDAPAEESAVHGGRSTGETVLVVEDDEDLRSVVERIFTRDGYRVVTAADGADALTLAAQKDGDIHLVVTDVNMPNMQGNDLVDKIREARPNIAALYMSGYDQPALASEITSEPGVGLIDKPFSAASLIAKARQMLDATARRP